MYRSPSLPVALASLLALGGCPFAGDSSPTDPLSEECRAALSSPATGAARPMVAIRDFEFVQAELRVPRGATVTWVNCELPVVDPHTTTSDTGIWDSGFLRPGETYTRTFTQAGRFAYHCAPHPFMTAVVIVE